MLARRADEPSAKRVSRWHGAEVRVTTQQREAVRPRAMRSKCDAMLARMGQRAVGGTNRVSTNFESDSDAVARGRKAASGAEQLRRDVGPQGPTSGRDELFGDSVWSRRRSWPAEAGQLARLGGELLF